MSFQLSTYLKEGTKSTHDQAETSQFQRRLANAEISRTDYADYMGQLYLIHRALEHGLASNAATKDVANQQEFQADYLARDLKVLGQEPDKVKPRNATKEMLARIESESKSNPLALLGYHYVLLGSKHGGKFIAAKVREKFEFDGEGCLYFDPYGTNFMPIWLKFKSNLDTAAQDETGGAIVLNAAKDMFEYFAKLGSELDAAAN
ncbi:MAG TPA: biliverdin-producing heme oxygenase [Planktothrix sp.]|jgi:heme oxygenase